MKKFIFLIKKECFFELFFDFLSTAFTVVIPLFTKFLFDGVENGTMNDKLFFGLVGIYCGCVFLGVLFSYFSTLYIWKSAIKFENSMKEAFFSSIMKYSFSQYSKNSVGEYISLQTNNITTIEQDYLEPLMDIFKSSNILIIAGVILFIYVDWRIALCIIILSFLLLFVPILTKKELSSKKKNYLDEVGLYTNWVTVFFNSFLLVNNITDVIFCQKHHDVLEEVNKKRYSFGKIKTISQLSSGLGLFILDIIVFSISGFLFISGSISAGVAVAAFGYASTFVSPTQSIVYDIQTINSSKETVSSFLKMINCSRKKAYANIKVFSSVGLNDYHVVLGKNSFCFNQFVAKSEKIYLKGANGSGKTTFLKSLGGLMKAESGCRVLNGKIIENDLLIPGLVYLDSKEPIFPSSFDDNVTLFGSYKKNGNVVNFFASLPQYSAIFNKNNCSELSSGEKQIISLMRALFQLPDLLILDEALSAVDAETFGKILSYLLGQDMAVIVVSHNFDVSNYSFDRRLLVKNGFVKEE